MQIRIRNPELSQTPLTQEVSVLEAAPETLALHGSNHLHREVLVTLSAQHERVVLCQSLAESAVPQEWKKCKFLRRLGQ